MLTSLCTGMVLCMTFLLKHRYVAIYFAILYVRYRAGIVTDAMMAIPKLRFVTIGILEALGVAAGMSSGGITNYKLF